MSQVSPKSTRIIVSSVIGLIILAVLLDIAINLDLFSADESNEPAAKIAGETASAESEQDESALDTNTQLVEELINEKCVEDTINVYITECAIELLDRKAAEREWKQRKLETAKHPQINKYDTFGILEDEQLKISQWRKDFEKMRDAWCNAKISFVTGSGIPPDIVRCQLEFELIAINDLGSLYYETILKGIYDSQGIPDFEPTNADIDVLVKVNATNRGCVWAGEEDCENATSPILLKTNKVDTQNVVLDVSNLTYNQVLNSKTEPTNTPDYYKSKYESEVIKWQAKISAYYSQITGIKFCVVDNDHQNIDIDKPCDLFWAFSDDVMDADNTEVNPDWDGQWVDYILNYYKVPFDKNDDFYDKIYTIIGRVNGIDCAMSERCSLDIEIIDIKKVESEQKIN